MEDNELIAEFMGLQLHDGMAVFDKTFNEPPEQLQYDTSWDWLMPVVAKITNTTPMNQSWYDIKYRLLDADIDAVYKRVVEFIKWYNEQNLTKK